MTKQTRQPMNTEKDQELDLDALDRVSAGTKNDHAQSIKDAIKKTLDQQAETFRSTNDQLISGPPQLAASFSLHFPHDPWSTPACRCAPAARPGWPLATKAVYANEWAPVQSSIAGPCIFVLSEGFLLAHQNVLRIDKRLAFALRSRG